MQSYRVRPGEQVRLSAHDPDSTDGFDGKKKKALAATRELTTRLERLQELLYADHRRSVLIVLQAIDAGGKDGTIRHVFEGVNPQGVRVARFGRPTPEESAHDFLWRVHRQTPEKGEITIFNRSHYEEVLVVRVEKLAPRSTWLRHYRQINDFERSLTEEGTLILKFFLHISFDEQRKRLEARLRDRTKYWKFSSADLPERKRWPAYQRAFEEMLEKTSTPYAPWYVIPANRKWFRNLSVSRILVEALDGLQLKWPPLPADFRSTVVP
ncbi:MAG: polyphosphate kinase 2 family protein [Thermoplasmata archaeon]|nr:polyphosphate kinase 2 family protein [Thermoplasmata archaeon]